MKYETNADFIIDLFGIRTKLEKLDTFYEGTFDEFKKDINDILALEKEENLKPHYKFDDTSRYVVFKTIGVRMCASKNIMCKIVEHFNKDGYSLEPFKVSLIFGCVKYYIKNPENLAG